MKTALFLSLVFCFILSPYSHAQHTYKFGKLTADDFKTNTNLTDSNTGAIIIADVGSSEITAKTLEETFVLNFNEHKRIQILKSSAFELATVEIYLYTDHADDEKLLSLKASSFNIDDGSVVETPVAPSSVFTEQRSRHWIVKKFTFPALKPGSIIDYQYTVVSDYFFNLRSWSFQDKYPCAWSEYSTSIPEFFRYVSLAQGLQTFTTDTTIQSSKFYSFKSPNVVDPSLPGGFVRGKTYTVRGSLFTHTWVAQDVPAMVDEPYTFTIKNNLLQIEFQLVSVQYSNESPAEVIGDWASFDKELLLAEEFGMDLKHVNGWLDDDLKTIVDKSGTDEEKARKIFAYVRDHFTCTDSTDFFLTTTLKEAYKRQHGSVGDINLLLIAFLRRAKINTMPVLLSTTDNGYTSNVYPMVQKYNYVVARVEINGKQIYLDASDKYNGFNRLPKKCYNGFARIIDDIPASIVLSPDSLEEMKISQAKIEINGDTIEGTINTTLGYDESTGLRRQISVMSKDEFVKQLIAKRNNDNLKIVDYQINNIENVDDPVQISIQFKIAESDKEDMIYFNPVLQPFYEKNPLIYEARNEPVEFPYCLNTVYVFQMVIPDGYEITETPKPERFVLNNNEGMFEYILAKNNQTLQMRCRLTLNKSNFEPDDYTALRNFFTSVINKQSQMLALKKK